MIKLLAVDMDGTCLDSQGKMSDITLRALKTAAEKGITVVPTTGRNLTCLPEKIKNEAFYPYVISSNGSLIVDMKRDREIFRAQMDSITATRLLKKFRFMPLFIAAHIQREYYAQGIFVYLISKHIFGKDAPTLRYCPSLSRMLKKSKANVEELQLFYKGSSCREKIEKAVAPFSHLCADHSKGYSEIYHRDGSKGKALLALGEMLGIKAEEIASIGDEVNDISMLTISGTAFVMGNAKEEIKALGDVILPTNDENGVATAIYDYILK